MKLAVNVENSFFDIPLKEQMLSVKNAGFDGVFFDWSDSEEFKENINFARELGLEIASIHAPLMAYVICGAKKHHQFFTSS